MPRCFPRDLIFEMSSNSLIAFWRKDLLFFTPNRLKVEEKINVNLIDDKRNYSAAGAQLKNRLAIIQK